MDSGIKLLVAIILGIIPFFITCYINFIVLSVYLLILTILTGIRLRTLLKSMVAYIIIIIFPYIFGLLIAAAVSKVTGSDMTIFYQSIEDVALRLLQLFILWYAGSLYFHSTPIESVVGVFDTLMSPLKRLGVPVSDFLKVIMCVVHELKELAPEVKETFSKSMRRMSGEGNGKFKIKFKGISEVLVSFIVNSFERLGKVEEFVRQVESKDLFDYKFSISKTDLLLVLSLVLLVVSMMLISNLFCLEGI